MTNVKLHFILAIWVISSVSCTSYKYQYYNKKLIDSKNIYNVEKKIDWVSPEKMRVQIRVRSHKECEYFIVKKYYKPIAVDWSNTYQFTTERNQETEACGDVDQNVFLHADAQLCLEENQCVPVGKVENDGKLDAQLENFFKHATSRDFQESTYFVFQLSSGRQHREKAHFSQNFMKEFAAYREEVRRQEELARQQREEEERRRQEARLQAAQELKTAPSVEVFVERFALAVQKGLFSELELKRGLLYFMSKNSLKEVEALLQLMPSPDLDVFIEFIREYYRLRQQQEAARDSDDDGIPDGRDACPQEAETVNGYKDEDGCPDQREAKVYEVDAYIRLVEKIYFENNSAEIRSISHDLLTQLANFLRARPDILVLEIQGHAGTNGDEGTNKRLSWDRAESVKKFLVNQGVSASRLVVKSYGVQRPIRQCPSILNRQDRLDCEEENRRVEFFILRRETRVVY